MSNKNDRALIPGSVHLPAVIEQRTRIINRVMGELTSRDTEAFFRRHPEFFRLVVSRHYLLSEALIARFADRWHIAAVSWHYDGNVRSLTPEQVERLLAEL